MEETNNPTANKSKIFKKGGFNLLILGIISVAVAVITTGVSLAIYHNSGDIYLDRSRPGYLPDEQEIEDSERQESEYEFNKSGKMDMEVLEEYLENLDSDVRALDTYGESFGQDALSDDLLKIPQE